jgi:hypothetical protein
LLRMARALWLVVVACAWWCATGSVLRSAQGVLQRAALDGTPVSCSTITLSKDNAAPYVVNNYDLWQSSTCSWYNGGGTINLAGPTMGE